MLGPARHVIVRLSLETPSMRQLALDQLSAAEALGCSISGYLWLYNGNDQRADVQRALEMLNNRSKVLWMDIEDYTNAAGQTSRPNASEIYDALDEATKQGVRGGNYTGEWMWPKLGNPSFAGVWLWSANYNFRATLEVPVYGGMELVGHQYTSTPFDRSVFLGQAAA